MSSVNKAIIIGRLGADPEVRHTQSNIAVATLSVATTEKYKDRDGKQVENTEWHRIVAWGRLAEICEQYLQKGSLAYFEGPIQTKEWEKDGVKRYTTEIKALTMQMLGSGGEQSGSSFDGGSDKPSNEIDGDFDEMDDDLPF